MLRKKRKIKVVSRQKTFRKFRDRPISYLIEAVFCSILLAVLAVSFMGFALNEPSLHVQKIRVEGTEMLDGAAIIEQSGVTSDDSIFLVKPDDIAQRLRQMPFIDECQVQRVFPDKLIIRIHERIPTATLVVTNRLFELDGEGNVLRELQPDEQHIGPLITDPAGVDSVQIGSRLHQSALVGALSVWRAFCRTEMATHVTVSEICAAQENRICLYCDEIKPEIRWGRSNFEKQAWKLDTLWKSRNGKFQASEYIDLRFGDDVALK